VSKLRRNYVKHGIAVCAMLFSLVYTASAQRLGDNFGNHKAIKDIDMGNNAILNAQGIVIGSTNGLLTSVAIQIDALDKAFLASRVADTSSILNPLRGMLIYSQKDDIFYFRQVDKGVEKWITFGSFSGGVTKLNGALGDITISSKSGSGITITSSTANGVTTLDIAADTTAAIWNADRLRGRVISNTVVPVAGQALVFDGTQWVPTAVSQITFSSIQGTTADSIVTTVNGTLRKLPAKSLVFVTDTAAMLRSLLRYSDTSAMLFPYMRTADTANMLKGYARLDNIPASGVTTVSIVNANGISGTVANPTTTPAITLTLGNITPTSVSASGAITGTTLAGKIVTPNQPNITSVGRLTNLSVSGIIDGGTFSGALSPGTLASITGLSTFNNITVTGFANMSTISGTLTTGNQPNITTVGTLTDLAVTGTITGGNRNTASAFT